MALKEVSDITFMVAPVSTAKDTGNFPTLQGKANKCVLEKAAIIDFTFAASFATSFVFVFEFSF